MQHDVIDGYRPLIYPGVLAKDRRRFAHSTGPAALRLLDSSTTSTGVTVNVYESAGEPGHGSLELEP